MDGATQNGVCNQRGRHISADLPRKDGLSTQIQYSAHVQHTARNRDVGDVRYPGLIGLRLVEVPIQQIGILMNGLLITGIWPAAADDRQQVQLAHHTQDRLDIHQLPSLALNPASNAANAIGLLALPLARHDQVNQPLILCFFLLPVSPGIISAAAYFKHFAHGFYAVFSAESLNHTILQFHLLPASNRKFRSNSTCIRSFANSLCCFPSSLSGSLWGRPLGRGCIQLPAFVPSFAVVPSGSSLVAFPDRSWLLFRHMSPLDYVALVQFQPIAPPLCTAVPYRNPPVAVSILRQEAPFFLCPLLGELSSRGRGNFRP